ncbi:unnamed protein product, partial [Cladocopium goreaui]
VLPLSEVIAEAGQGQGQDGPGLSLRDRLLRQAAGKVLGCWCDLQLRVFECQSALRFTSSADKVATQLTATTYSYIFQNMLDSTVRVLLEEDPEGMLQAAKKGMTPG